jgi:hypothetical protein
MFRALSTVPTFIIGGESEWFLDVQGLVGTTLLQRAYLPHTDQAHRRDTMKMVATNHMAVALIALARLTILCRGDEIWIYLLPVAILLSFLAVGTSAWVLPVEIDR